MLWIFKFQARFRLSDVAIDLLIKFFNMVLLDADWLHFEDFPTSSFMAKKMLGIDKQAKIYAVCPDCDTLYKISEILQKNVNNQSNSRFKCTHIEFPNHPRKSQRNPYETEITKQISIVKGYIRKPKMVFPLPSLKAQLITMY